MVQQNLVSYILTQMRQGKTLEELNRFLIGAGYDKTEVESSIQYVLNTQTNPKLAEEQRIQQLTDYIQKQLQAGFQQQAISNFLVSRGYPYYEVNSALQQATLPKREEKVQHKMLILALIMMFVMTSAVTFMYFKAYTKFGFEVPEKLLDVEAEKLTTLVQQGGTLDFRVKLINFGYERRYDVALSYKIIDRQTQGTVLEQTETLALSTTLENIVKFDIPETMKPGKYVLRVDATYQEFTATSGFIFEVLPKELAQEKIDEIKKMIPEEENATEIPELEPEEKTPVTLPVTPPAVNTTTPTQTPVQPAPTGEAPFYEGKTREQAFEMVKAVSVREPQRAIEMCKSFEYIGNIEQCLMMLAQFKKDSIYCEQIEKVLSKDNCYIDTARATGNFEFCNQVTTSQLKQNCKMLSFVADAKKSAQSGESLPNPFGLLVSPPTI